jgi:hypothetical protein
MSAATKPSMPFVEHHRDYPCMLPPTVPGKNVRVVERHLYACRIDPGVISTVASVAGFNQDFDHIRKLQGDFKYDPEGIMEHYYSLVYRLLLRPEPFRDFDEVISPSTSAKLDLHTQDFPTPQSMISATDADSVTKAIESAMRILALWYLREPTNDFPCGENIMLELLEGHVKAILADRQPERTRDMLIDPLLLQESRAAQKPTLIWICIAGDIFSTRRMEAPREDHSGQPSVYRQLLMEVLGAEASRDPSKVPEDDLELCQYLDFRYVKDEWWDEREAMRHILGLSRTW